MDRLAAEGRVYAQAAAQAPWTLPSTASILSGRLPTEHWVTADALRADERDPLADDAPDPGRARSGTVTSAAAAVRAQRGSWLPTTLQERGYRTFGVSCNPWISTWNGFSLGFDRFVDIRPWPPLPKSEVGIAIRRARQAFGRGDHGGEAALRAFQRFVAHERGTPWFSFVNLMELHDPYDPPLRFHPLVRGAGGGPGWFAHPQLFLRQLGQRRRRADPDRWYLASIRSLYYATARYEDDLLGRFVRILTDRDRPALVVVVSDHGENLGEHGLFEHHSSLHQTLLHVPLAIWGNKVDVGQGTVEDPVPLTGLAPFLAGAAEGDAVAPAANGDVLSEYESTVRRPGGVRLRPELAQLERTGRRDDIPALAYHAGISIRRGNLKYVAVENGDEMMYDLALDPSEERDVLEVMSHEAGAFREARQAWQRRRAGQPGFEAGAVAEREIEDHLRALGYLE
jgi:arylsulfatase A-like enzyme